MKKSCNVITLQWKERRLVDFVTNFFLVNKTIHAYNSLDILENGSNNKVGEFLLVSGPKWLVNFLYRWSNWYGTRSIFQIGLKQVNLEYSEPNGFETVKGK